VNAGVKLNVSTFYYTLNDSHTVTDHPAGNKHAKISES